MSEYQWHQFSTVVRPFNGAEMAVLVEDVRIHGVRKKGILFQGMILDGRHRYKACQNIGIEMEWEVFEGTEQEALDYVLSSNIHRQLNAEDRSRMLVKVAEIYVDRKWEKKQKGLANQALAITPGSTSTQNQLSKTTGFSKATVQRAVAIAKDGVPKLKEMVSEVGFKAAAAIAAKPKPEQRKLIHAGPEAMRAAVAAPRDHSNAYTSTPAMKWSASSSGPVAPLRVVKKSLSTAGVAPVSKITVANNGAVNPIAPALDAAGNAVRQSATKKAWADYFVKIIEACYAENQKCWNTIGTVPGPLMVVEAIVKAVRA